MAIDAALGRLGNKSGVCTSSTRPTNPFEGQLIYETDTNRTLVYDNAAWLVVADNQVLSIDSANGRVGVGTTAPTVALQVDSGSTDQFAAPQIYVAPSGHASSDRAAIQLDDIQLLTDIAGDGTEDFSIYSNNAAAHRFSIDGSGNVGINDFSPSYTLDVNGDINTTGSLRIGGTPVGEWVSFTPSWDFSGNSITTTGFNYGYYLVVGDLKIVRAGFRYSSSSGGGSLRLVLPSAAGFSRSGIHTYTRDGYAHRYDASANANYLATPFYWNSDTVIGFYHEGGAANVTDTVPVSWGGNDEFFCTLIGTAP